PTDLRYFDVVLSANLLACIGAHSSAVIVQNGQLVDIVYFDRVPLATPDPRPTEGRLQPSEVRPDELFVLFRLKESAHLGRVVRVPYDSAALNLLCSFL
ncbi:hypothetical protein MPH_14128, partial [Macrophomina phaseolina MS6]